MDYVPVLPVIEDGHRIIPKCLMRPGADGTSASAVISLAVIDQDDCMNAVWDPGEWGDQSDREGPETWRRSINTHPFEP